jgi:hypothetical protein
MLSCFGGTFLACVTSQEGFFGAARFLRSQQRRGALQGVLRACVRVFSAVHLQVARSSRCRLAALLKNLQMLHIRRHVTRSSLLTTSSAPQRVSDRTPPTLRAPRVG